MCSPWLIFLWSQIDNWTILNGLCSRFHCARVARRVPHIGCTTVSRSLRLSLHSLPSCVNWLPTYAQLKVDLNSRWLHYRLHWGDWAQKKIMHVRRSWWQHWYRNRNWINKRYVCLVSIIHACVKYHKVNNLAKNVKEVVRWKLVRSIWSTKFI